MTCSESGAGRPSSRERRRTLEHDVGVRGELRQLPHASGEGGDVLRSDGGDGVCAVRRKALLESVRGNGG